MAAAGPWKKNDLQAIAARCGEEFERYNFCRSARSGDFVASTPQ
jgi:hypothetical protein